MRWSSSFQYILLSLLESCSQRLKSCLHLVLEFPRPLWSFLSSQLFPSLGEELDRGPSIALHGEVWCWDRIPTMKRMLMSSPRDQGPQHQSMEKPHSYPSKFNKPTPTLGEQWVLKRIETGLLFCPSSHFTGKETEAHGG